MDDKFASWAGVVLFEMLNEAAFANYPDKRVMTCVRRGRKHQVNKSKGKTRSILTGMEAFSYSCGINEVSLANLASNVRIKGFQLNLPLHTIVIG